MSTSKNARVQRWTWYKRKRVAGNRNPRKPFQSARDCIATSSPAGKRTDPRSLTAEPDRHQRRGTLNTQSYQPYAPRFDLCRGKHSTLCPPHQNPYHYIHCKGPMHQYWHNDYPSSLCPGNQGTMADYSVSLTRSGFCRLKSCLRPLFYFGINPVFHSR
jgi:hypothetical protein